MRFYFDHNSCTPVDPRVLERFMEVEASCPGNPGSLHGSGRHARGIVEEARFAVARALDADADFGVHVDADHVYFVSGGTEANNAIVHGAGDTSRPVLCAPIEHPSVLECAERRGACWWKVDARGAAIITPPERDVGLVTLVHGQNEVGTLQPIEAAGQLAAELGVPFHVDASQTLGRCPLDVVLAHASSVALSTHKAAGLRGLAILVDKGGATEPLMFGGGQQRARRPGTESPALAAATALALELALAERVEHAAHMRAARDAFVAELQSDEVRMLTPEDSLPNTAMLHFASVDGRGLLPALDLAGVEASQGSACSSGSPTPPRILRAMGLDEATARSCVRFSFSHHTTCESAVEGARVVERAVLGMRTR